jgi:hypothetical protein
MVTLVLGAGIFFTAALILREFQLARERAMHMAAFDQLRLALEGMRAQLRRNAEDIYVMQVLLAERSIFNEAELARARARLIEAPKRNAEERESIQRHLGREPTHLVLDENDGKIH